MNSFNAQAVFDGTSYLAVYRLSHKARLRPVLDARKKVVRYPTPEQAKIAAHEALLAELNGNPRYWRGPRRDDARTEAEKHFRKVGHGKDGTKAQGCGETPAERAAISTTS